MTARTDAGKVRPRGGGPRALAQSLGAVTRQVFGRRGLADGAILNDWHLIAGEHLARHSLPEKVTFPQGTRVGGRLQLRIDNGSMAMELMHLEPLLIERINGYFGFKAVAGLKIIQGPLPRSEARRRAGGRALKPAEERDLAESLMDVGDPELKQSLAALGRAVIGRKPA
ncbi:MAG TPA: DciA family protein [Rhodospirillales bacterium]